jgi:hypothetical protein
MTQEQINRLEMFEACNRFLDEQLAVWNAVPIISRYKTQLTELIAAIKEEALRQDAAQVFISSSLHELKKQLANKLDLLDDLLEAYAADTGNVQLENRATNSASDYFRLPNEDFETKSKGTIDLLATEVANMGDYGLTPEQIEDARQSLDLFLERRGKPRAYRIASRMATGTLGELFSQASAQLDRLDNVMKRFRSTHPTFYKGYLAARTIVDR